MFCLHFQAFIRCINKGWKIWTEVFLLLRSFVHKREKNAHILVKFAHISLKNAHITQKFAHILSSIYKKEDCLNTVP